MRREKIPNVEFEMWQDSVEKHNKRAFSRLDFYT